LAYKERGERGDRGENSHGISLYFAASVAYRRARRVPYTPVCYPNFTLISRPEAYGFDRPSAVLKNVIFAFNKKSHYYANLERLSGKK
jgi:hypothetical protein